MPIKKELHNGKTTTYKLKFIDIFRFVSPSSSKLVYNLPEIYSKQCRDKNCKSECEFRGRKSNNLSYRCSECKKKQLKAINGFINKFPNSYTFCNSDIDKFILLLRKGVYPYEYTWMAEKDLVKQHCLIKEDFIVNYI